MMCQHCQMNVEKALAAVEGVERAVVDLDKKEAEVGSSKRMSMTACLQGRFPRRDTRL